MELFAYIDESGDPNVRTAEADPWFHVGMVLGTTPIEHALVARALENLRNDPDAADNPKDHACLERGYFHASFDSANAHSHWCREVAAFQFEVHVESADKRRVSNDRDLRDALHRRLVHFLMVNASRLGVTRFDLSVAARSITLPVGSGCRVRDEFMELLTHSAASMPQFPVCFPATSVNTVPASTPGIQAVDFLLWAAVRQHGPSPVGRCQWADRAGLRLMTQAREEHGTLQWQQFVVGPPIPWQDTLPHEPPEPRHRPSAWLRWAEQAVLRWRDSGDVPAAVQHFNDDIVCVANRISGGERSADVASQLGRVMLRVIDTAPLYDPADPRDVGMAYLARTAFGVVSARTDLRWVSMANEWRRAEPSPPDLP